MLTIFGDPAVIFEGGFAQCRYICCRREKFKSRATVIIPTVAA
jgi:hypothetical protein